MSRKINIFIIKFPGSNCDRDLQVAIKSCTNIEPKFIWHQESHIETADIIFLPGGFSFGDYLRAGIMATKSPAIKEVIRHSKKGALIVGICNGFQILTECNLLEGALIRNNNQLFKCKETYLKIKPNSFFKNKLNVNEVVKFPIAHAQGNFFADKDLLKKMEDRNQIVFKYSSVNGEIKQIYNPNGSLLNIAGITNKTKNVLGLMPHPERAIEEHTTMDGIKFFNEIIEMV